MQVRITDNMYINLHTRMCNTHAHIQMCNTHREWIIRALNILLAEVYQSKGENNHGYKRFKCNLSTSDLIFLIYFTSIHIVID